MPKYDIIVRPADSNAFSIIGATLAALKSAGISKEEQDLYTKEATNGDYNQLLQVTMKWVNLQPTRGFEVLEETDD